MHLKPDERIDWFRVIVDLCRVGYTTHTIAASIGRSQGTVCNWKEGAEPRHSDGLKLIWMWAESTGNNQESVHVISRYSCKA